LTGPSRAYTVTREPSDDGAIALTPATHDLLDVLGVRVVLGRPFARGDDAVAGRTVALITSETWRARFGGSSDVLARELWLGDTRASIVGVLPPGFIPPSSRLDIASGGLVLDDQPLAGLAAGAARSAPPYIRLRADVRLDAAQSELAGIVAGLERQQPLAPPGARMAVRFVPIQQDLFGRFARYLWLVGLAGVVVFAGACASVGSLMIVRGRARQQTLALQMAFGASRARLMRGALVETMLLAGAATAAAMVALAASRRALDALLPPIFSRYAASTWEPRVIGWALLGVGAAAIAAGAWPGWRASRVDLIGLGQRAESGRASRRLTGSTLLGVQAALGVLLVVAASATVRSFVGLALTPLGIETDRLHHVEVGFVGGAPPDVVAARSRSVLEALAGVGWVETVAGAVPSPMRDAIADPFGGQDFRRASLDEGRRQVTDGLIEMLGLRLIAGRTFSADDMRMARPVSVLSERGVRRVWPDIAPAAAVGRTLTFAGEAPRQVIGVVSDFRLAHAEPLEATHYVPIETAGYRRLDVVARARPGAAVSVAAVRDTLAAAGLHAATIAVRSVEQDQDGWLRDQRFRAALFSLFGVVAWLLASIGLYATCAFDVEQRRREMGIRHALGARAGALQRLVILHAVRPVVIGLVCGLAVAWWAAQFLQSFLHQVDARGPWLFAAVALALVLTAMFAAWIPARRAARTDPAAVLRG
jgi:predicted permease